MHPVDLERLVQRQLAQLPAPTAPPTLLPHVMAAVQRWAERPWYTRAWVTWPRTWQAVSTVTLVALIAGGAVLLPRAQAALSGAAAILIAGTPAAVTVVVQHAGVATNTLHVLWRALLEPVAAYACALVALACIACVVIVTTLNHVAFGRTVPS